MEVQKSLGTASVFLKGSQRLFSIEKEEVTGDTRHLAASWWPSLTTIGVVAQGKY
jgi:hypothetical protein